MNRDELLNYLNIDFHFINKRIEIDQIHELSDVYLNDIVMMVTGTEHEKYMYTAIVESLSDFVKEYKYETLATSKLFLKSPYDNTLDVMFPNTDFYINFNSYMYYDIASKRFRNKTDGIVSLTPKQLLEVFPEKNELVIAKVIY